MNRSDCDSEQLSSRAIGLFVLPFVLLFAIAANVFLPIVGLFFTIPLLIINVLFILAPKSEACRLIS